MRAEPVGVPQRSSSIQRVHSKTRVSTGLESRHHTKPRPHPPISSELRGREIDGHLYRLALLPLAKSIEGQLLAHDGRRGRPRRPTGVKDRRAGDNSFFCHGIDVDKEMLSAERHFLFRDSSITLFNARSMITSRCSLVSIVFSIWSIAARCRVEQLAEDLARSHWGRGVCPAMKDLSEALERARLLTGERDSDHHHAVKQDSSAVKGEPERKDAAKTSKSCTTTSKLENAKQCAN